MIAYAMPKSVCLFGYEDDKCFFASLRGLQRDLL